MRLSFVIPAYNEEAYLPGCIESILSQARDLIPFAEIIVVNNASTDKTREVASRYPEVRVVDEPRKGLTYARQAGFAASSGSLIANVDADCRLTSGWVANVLSAFNDTPSLAALSGPFVYYDLTPSRRLLVRIFYITAFATYFINRRILRVGSMVQGGNFVINRKALESIGGFNTDISFYGEDTDIARRLSTVGEVRFTFGLKMFSSGRRLKHEGILATAARYSINYFWTTFFKRPYTQSHTDIRENQNSPTQDPPPQQELYTTLTPAVKHDPITEPDDDFPFLDPPLAARMREHNLPLPSGVRMSLTIKVAPGNDHTPKSANPPSLGKLFAWTSSPLQKGAPHKPILAWREKIEDPGTRDLPPLEPEAAISDNSGVRMQRHDVCMPGHIIPRTRGQIVLPGRRVLVNFKKGKG